MDGRADLDIDVSLVLFHQVWIVRYDRAVVHLHRSPMRVPDKGSIAVGSSTVQRVPILLSKIFSTTNLI